VHRDARFFDAPLEFRPERFAGGVTQQRAAGEYLPFGLGPTSCPGEHLARLQMVIAVDGILSRFDLEAVEGDVPQPRSANLFTMQPDRPIRVVLRERAVAGTPALQRMAG
jgi:cytochrome P450